MTTENVLGIWRFARDHFLPGLEKTAWNFMTSRFVEIYKEEEFSELPAEMLRILLVLSLTISAVGRRRCGRDSWSGWGTTTGTWWRWPR